MLWGGYAAANVLKWYWWRFNGYGYFWGMIIGILAALIVPKLLPELSALEGFPIILTVSVIGCIGSSLATRPESDEILMDFYSQVRPWGFWRPVHEKVIKVSPGFKRNKNLGRDWFNILIGMIWQISLVAVPMYLVIKDLKSLAIVVVVVMTTSIILKKNWYDKLEEGS